MLKPWNNNWSSCLVRRQPAGEQGLDHMRLKHRIDIINEGFFYPQARAIVGKNDVDAINRIVKGARIKARTIATQEMRDGTPCEMPIMTWVYIDNLAYDTLSEYPSKEEIVLLLNKCYRALDLLQQGRHWKNGKKIKINNFHENAEQEICYTIWELKRVLKEWGLNDTHPLHFYSHNTRRFQTYEL